MALYRCNECGETMPADPIGAALMQEHLNDKHPILPKHRGPTVVRKANSWDEGYSDAGHLVQDWGEY
jgi:hypothetical protein